MSYISATYLRGSPFDLADRLGIKVRSARGLPFEVGSSPGVVLYLWDESPTVRADRVWEGLAQCLLTGSGVEWSPEDAVEVAIRLGRVTSRIT